jgi:Family of unknown function (DUF6182)
VTPGQAPDRLAAALARRVADCQRLAGDGGDGGEDVQLALVLEVLDLAAVARGAVGVASGLEATRAGRWAANYTKCLVLLGSPRKLAGRCAFTRQEGHTAWLGPQPARQLEGPRRLLRPLRTDREVVLPAELDVELDAGLGASGGARRATLLLATQGVRLEHYLVSLHHVLCEATLLGALERVRWLRLVHVRTIDDVDEGAAYTRVQKEQHDATQLRVYGSLYVDRA